MIEESKQPQLSFDERSKLEVELVTKVRLFHHLLNSGMLEGKYGSREANRRNLEITKLRNTLGITKKQQTSLVNSHTLRQTGV